MSDKAFFLKRYRTLGWNYQKPNVRQAIRINVSNADTAKVISRLEKRGIKISRIPFLPNGHWVDKAKVSVGATTEYLLGYYSIQEAAAQIPATLFSDTENKTALDSCAAPGGKTVQLANLMRNTGAIVALDVDKTRLRALANHLERCRVSNVIVFHQDARKASELETEFDRILVDAPCSGNFATDSQWFSRRTMEDIERNASIQREILKETSRLLTRNGELVYSTCSLEPEEDELNVDWAVKNLNLETQPIGGYGKKSLTTIFGKQLDRGVGNCKRIWPTETQGFFMCKFRRRENA